jgi:hypothetical protein
LAQQSESLGGEAAMKKAELLKVLNMIVFVFSQSIDQNQPLCISAANTLQHVWDLGRSGGYERIRALRR